MPLPASPSRTVLADLARLGGVAVLAGVLVAVAVTPGVALTGLAAKHGIELFEGLPSDLRTVPLDQRTEITAVSKGKEVVLATLYDEDRRAVGWSDVPVAVRNAAVAGEDVRFYEHGGVDPQGILRALVSNLSGSEVQGASTITQQYVKNVCVQAAERKGPEAAGSAYEACTGASYGRKLREMRLAIGVEKRHTKDEVLLAYLNIVGFGGRVYGIEAASERYFGTRAKDLSVGEAASLLAIVNDPSRLRPDLPANLAANTERRDHILDVELQERMITRAQRDAARAAPVALHLTDRTGCRAAGSAAYFCDYVVSQVEHSPRYGATPAERRARLERGGLRIRTTLDLDLQQAAQRTMRDHVPASTDGWTVAGTGTSIEAGTGRILTMVQNTRYSDADERGSTVVNYNTDRAGGGSSGFQPGSTFKLFTLLEWLRTGHGLDDRVDGSARTIGAGGFTRCGRHYPESWTFANSHDEKGTSTVLHGTARSINGVFASMAQRLDLCDIRDLAKRMGVGAATGGDIFTSPSFVIGQSSGIAPLALTGAYAALANDGVYCPPVAIERVLDAEGKALPAPGKECERVVSKKVAVAAVHALRGVVTGDGTASADRTGDGIWEFGKTGTTDATRGTWMIGSTSEVTTGVMVANNGSSQDLNRADLGRCALLGSSRAADERHCLWRGMQAAANAVHGGAKHWAAPAGRYLRGSGGD